MLHFKHAALALGAFALTACTIGNVGPDDAKGKLEGAGYTVSVISAADYEKTPTAEALPGNAALDNYLSASKKEEHNYLFAWYFSTMDAAETWNDLYTIELGSIKSEDEEAKFTMGRSNNVVWVGTNAAAKTAGFTLF